MASAHLQRRTVTKGVAWSIPAVSVALAAPAFAGSPAQCVLDIGSSSGISNPTVDDQWVTYQMSFGQVEVKNLPEGVTVTEVTTTKYLAHDNFRWLNNPTGEGNGAQYLTADGETWDAFSVETGTMFFYDSKGSTAGSPVWNLAVYEQNGAQSTGPTGSDSPHDYATYTTTWYAEEDPTYNTLRQGQYSTCTGEANDPCAGDDSLTAGCVYFEVPELGEFSFREPRNTTLWQNETNAPWRSYQTYTVTLSDGRIMTWSTWDSERSGDFYGMEGSTPVTIS